MPLPCAFSALFNIVPTWEADKMMGVGYAAMVVTMGLIPFGMVIKIIHWVWKILAVGIACYLCYLLWLNAGEQVSIARERISDGAVAKIAAFDDYKERIKKKKVELKAYVDAKGWKIGSQEGVNGCSDGVRQCIWAPKDVCKPYPYGQLCKDATAAAPGSNRSSVT